MTRPAVYFTTEIECQCGRRRHTREDLDRWHADLPLIGPRAPDPPWARALCWYTADVEACPMKPLE